MFPKLKHKSNQDLKYLETIASTPSSPSSTTQTTATPQTALQEAYLKWSKNFDELINTELGRKLFQEYLKETQDENILMLYIVFLCLQHSRKEEQIKRILQSSYNFYFKNKNFVKKKLLQLMKNHEKLIEDLCKSLEQAIYDEQLIKNFVQELKICLERQFYVKFIKSKMFIKFMQIIQKNEKYLFASNLNVDEQFKFIIDLMDDDCVQKKHQQQQEFVMPDLPVDDELQLQSQPQQLKSKSKSKLNDSLTSKKSLDLQSKKSQRKQINMPPNPYHTSSNTVLLVSAQDSELQSLASDVPLIDDDSSNEKSKNKRHYSRKNEKEALNSSVITNVSLKSLQRLNGAHLKSNKSNSHFDKAYEEMREQAKLNKNVNHNMPEVQVPRTEEISQEKKQLPLSQADPKEFARLLIEKLEKLVIDEKSKKLNNTSSTTICANVSYDNLKLDSTDIDAERMIDEHLNRVFKAANAPEPSSFSKSINNASPKHHNKTKHNKSGTDLQSALNNTCGSYLNVANASLNLSLNSALMSTTTSFLSKTNYQLMTQACKEVDIDQQQQQQQKQQQQYSHAHHHHPHHQHQQQQYQNGRTANYIEQNYDSGVSMRSTASIERVSDWLATSNCNTNYPSDSTANDTTTRLQQTIQNQQQNVNTDSSIKTTVAYYLPGEDVAYITSFNGTKLTLAQFKQLITKKGHFRYFFKTKSDLLDEECIVFQEITDESAIVPMFKDKVIAKIEKTIK